MSYVEGKWMAKWDEKVGENEDSAKNIPTMKTAHWCLLILVIWMLLRIVKTKDLIINIWAAKLGL
jgi:hypothetical protein